jgi:dolichol-phosphate mannosyltransferase
LVSGGSVGEKWGVFRKINSWVATQLARPFAGATRDPMSGFFAMKRSTFDRAERLTPLGYKIGLELMCKCRVSNVLEIPIHFAERAHGHSKLSLKEQFRYLEHLSRLYDFCYPRLSPIAKFLIVTILGWLVGLGMFIGLLRLGASAIAAPMGGYLGAILVTAIFHRRYIRTQREFLLTKHPWREFFLIALAEIVAVFVVAAYIVHRVTDARPWELFIIAFAAGTLVRYILRKELMQDIRGLRREFRKEELT